MVLGCLRGDPEKELTGYLRKVQRSLLRTLCCYLASNPNNLFRELKTQIPNTPLREQVRWALISDETWTSIDARVTVRQEGALRTVRKLCQQVRAVLNTDWKQRTEKAGSTIEFLLEFNPPLLIEARVRMQGWYKIAAFFFQVEVGNFSAHKIWILGWDNTVEDKFGCCEIGCRYSNFTSEFI